ncbi:ZFAND2B (predicted) [Pycnogonum litorale]
MEFPNLGKHCSEKTCYQLDFLPMKCDACTQIFCKDHVRYDDHSCNASYKKDVQVPVCPLCNKPIPVTRGQSPDMIVGQHIDRDCQSDPAKANRRVYTNVCSVKRCKEKMPVPVTCRSCKKNYCLKHKIEQDHNCTGRTTQNYKNDPRAAARDAALARLQHNTSSSSSQSNGTAFKSENKGKGGQKGIKNYNVSSIQNSKLSDGEALTRTMKLSMNLDNDTSEQNNSNVNDNKEQEEEDRLLALAIAESERQHRRDQRPRASNVRVS